MKSRLDRLFVLLEAGTGPATRRAAARQLGEVQKAHPEELHRLLGRLMKHLRSPAWDTRVAAAQAVEAILSNVPEWHPTPSPVKKEEKTDPEDSGRLRCDTFDIERVLQQGAHLMGSEGHEYDLDEEALSAADINERLAKQRQQLNARLCLDVAASVGVDISSIYTNEDLCPVKPQPIKTETSRRPVQELVSIVSSKPLSSREMNLAKRRARAAFSKQKSRDCTEEGPSAPPTPPAEPDRKKIKLELPDEYVAEGSWCAPEADGSWSEAALEASRWPLDAWCGVLQAQLFNSHWEARHGAAGALRELLRSRIALTAGMHANLTQEQMEEAHQDWLEDMALRLLCVLALDRFGDFVSDQVVAPVRETCAQTLGVALAQLCEARVRRVAQLLSTLAAQPQWEARHGALLGFKYMLAARQEIACDSGALEHLMEGLCDAAEDVSAVAAGALAPAAGALAAARRARAQLQAQHERERVALRERARTLQRRLAALDSEYSAQLDSLRAAYQSAVAADTHGDGLRARYQQEIEQLRALCEKGLMAMESSHRRIVREMEEKHRAEREQLRLDKEQALAEETRATLAALDAMRKAHESEVRREVDKFKAEFLSRGAHGDLSHLSSRHQQEMEEIKREILSLSEKYSVKCVESAALEERLASATAQLAQAHNHIMQLDARNKQLRAHLISEANEMKNSESSALSQLYEDSSSHGMAEAPLWTHLRQLAAAWQRANKHQGETIKVESPVGGGEAGASCQDSVREDRDNQKPAAITRPELKSTQRCSPLVGMVAERKKRFELL